MAITQEQGLDIEALEGMVDRHGLDGVLNMLSEICGEKAEHVRSNWQDEPGGKIWDKRASIVDAATSKVLDT